MHPAKFDTEPRYGGEGENVFSSFLLIFTEKNICIYIFRLGRNVLQEGRLYNMYLHY